MILLIPLRILMLQFMIVCHPFHTLILIIYEATFWVASELQSSLFKLFSIVYFGIVSLIYYSQGPKDYDYMPPGWKTTLNYVRITIIGWVYRNPCICHCHTTKNTLTLIVSCLRSDSSSSRIWGTVTFQRLPSTVLQDILKNSTGLETVLSSIFL